MAFESARSLIHSSRTMNSLFLYVILFISIKGFAYPDYAVRYNNISCTSCHISPVGGGPRNVDGKLFGAHGYKVNSLLIQPYVSADFRALFYNPQRPSSSKGGMGIMSGSIAGHVPLDAEKKIHLVIEQNIAGFSAAPYRDTYALFKLSDKLNSNWFESILVGRFRAPFGIITDEHRTYTHIQTATEWYTFENGILLSGTPSDKWHYDFGVVSGENSAGQNLNNGGAERSGALINFRWMPGAILFGVSGSFHDHEPRTDSTKAVALYSILSLARWTENKIPVSFKVEHARAWNWNSNLGRGFASDPNYVTAVGHANSLGWLAELDWELSEIFTLIYKYDFLQPDQNYASDIYDRQGIGFRWMIGPNTMIQVRTETARATVPSEANGAAQGAQDSTFAVLQLAL